MAVPFISDGEDRIVQGMVLNWFINVMGQEHYTHSGGATDNLCLPEEPKYGEKYNDACEGNRAYLYGMEYEMAGNDILSNLNNYDVPCAVCRTYRQAMLMIPGRNECYDTWTLEYAGYLAAGYYRHAAASEYICLDKDAETISGSQGNMDGRTEDLYGGGTYWLPLL